MQNTSAGDFSERLSSDSGYASARDMHQNDLGLAMSTRDRFNVLKPSARNGLQVTTSVLTRSKTPDSKRYGEMVSKVVSSGQAPGQRVAPPRRSTIHTISTKNKVRVPSGSANVDNVPLARNRRKSIHAINAAGTNDPTLASGNGMNRRCDVAYRRDRRNSIDCTYHVLRPGMEDIASSLRVPGRSLDYETFGGSDHQQTIFPPLEEKANKLANTPTVDSSNFRNIYRKRNYSASEKLNTQASLCGGITKQNSPSPPKASPEIRDNYKKTLSYGDDQSLDCREQFHANAKSPNQSGSSQYAGGGSSPHDQQNIFVFGSAKGQPPSTQSRSNTSSSAQRQQYRQRGEELSHELFNSKKAALCLKPRQDRLEQKGHGRAHRKIRSTGVHSPCSRNSSDKPADGNHFNVSRRFSLPSNNLLGNGLDKYSSPEFYKAFQELKSGNSSKKERRFSGDRRTSSAKSNSSVHSVKPQSTPTGRRDLLQKIEENFPDSHVAINAKENQATSCLSQNGDTRETGPDEGNEVTERISHEQLDTSRNQDNRPVSDDVTRNRTEDESLMDTVPQTGEKTFNKSNEIKPQSQSLFVIPPLGSANNKVISKLEHEKEISKNETNRHFVVGDLINGVTTLAKDCASEDDDNDYNNIDISVLRIRDDDLCDEDLKQKRILQWLMQVETGRSAETIVRETPPPSPEPGRANAIVVIYNDD